MWALHLISGIQFHSLPKGEGKNGGVREEGRGGRESDGRRVKEEGILAAMLKLVATVSFI